MLSRLPLVPLLVPGAAVTRAQVTPYESDWQASNERDWERTGPLWVVIGDSTAQGIGASRYDLGYVGRVRALLDAETDQAWRVLNLSRSGDRTDDVIHNQLPILLALEEPAALVSYVAGVNDLLHTRTRRLLRLVDAAMRQLPDGSIIGTLPQGLRGTTTSAVNRLIEVRAAGRLRVADIWRASGPPWRGKLAVDQFHPSDRGYAMWANAVAAAAGLRGRVTVPELGMGE